MKLTEKLRHRITEVIVIVVSILLAFSLEAQWDEKRESREMHLVHIALTDEFKAVEEEFDFVLDRNELVISAADSLLSVLSLEVETLDVYAETVGLLLLTPTTDPRSGTLDALIASGRLDLLENPSLQALLANWSANLEDVREEELAAKSFVHESLITYLDRNVENLAPIYDWRIAEGRGKGAIPDELRQVRVTLHIDLQLINLIQTRRYLANVILINYFLIEDAADQIRRELEK